MVCNKINNRDKLISELLINPLETKAVVASVGLEFYLERAKGRACVCPLVIAFVPLKCSRRNNQLTFTKKKMHSQSIQA